jgi:hypothetical protein
MTFRISQVLLGVLLGMEALRALGAGYYGNYTRFPFYIMLSIAICMILVGVQKQTVSVKFMSVVSMLLLSSLLLTSAVLCFRLPPEVLGMSQILILSVLQLGLALVYAFTISSNRYVGGAVLSLSVLPILVVPVAYFWRQQNGDYLNYAVSIFRTSPEIDLDQATELLRAREASVRDGDVSLVTIGRIGPQNAASNIAVVLCTQPRVGVQIPLPSNGVTVALYNSNGWCVAHASKEYGKNIVLVPAPQGVTIMSDRQEAGWHGFAIDDDK